MESPGEYLKREREHRGITLQNIHEATRISMKYLRALEADDYDSLPHPTFTKGFIKSYASRLGIDEVDAALRYEMFLRERSASAEPPGSQERSYKKAGALFKKGVPANVAALGAVSSAVIIAIVVYLAFVKRPAGVSAPAAPIKQVKQAAPAQNAPVPAPAAAPGPPVQTAPQAVVKPSASAPQAPAGSKVKEKPKEAADMKAAEAVRRHTLGASAADTVWIKLTIDANPEFDVLLKPGESAQWKAEKGFALVIGNAGGVALTFDGKRLARLGERNQVVRIKLPPEGGAGAGAQ